MNSTDSTLMQMLTGQMRYMSSRQSVLAQNIANVDTPQYQAQDLKKLDFANLAAAESHRLDLRATSAKHMHGTIDPGTAFAAQKDRDTFEITPVGNNVVLEEQMANISDTGAQFQIANSLFKKFHTMYRAALGNR